MQSAGVGAGIRTRNPLHEGDLSLVRKGRRIGVFSVRRPSPFTRIADGSCSPRVMDTRPEWTHGVPPLELSQFPQIEGGSLRWRSRLRLTDRDVAGRIGRIMRSFLRQVALACVIASVLPQAAAAAVALHVLLDHGEEHGGAVAFGSMVPALHGHVHSAETPDHDHPLTVPASGSVASHARGPLQPALPVGCVATCASCVLVDVSAVDTRSATRRPTQAIPTVLRI